MLVLGLTWGAPATCSQIAERPRLHRATALMTALGEDVDHHSDLLVTVGISRHLRSMS